ncbi:MAG: helicase, superfamily [Mucilaginibacter sp.]|nr:helicase, superfamily [Mucilaginibacter sp.]
MAERKLEPEVIEILELIKHGNHFLLSGGAGSGKTYSLVHVIKEVLGTHPSSAVACMTYTNAAVKEIEKRVGHPNLRVSTIHDFLWEVMAKFQKELKLQLIHLINDPDSAITVAGAPVLPDYFDQLENGIAYKEWTRIANGEISHDEILELANAMFKNYPLLSAILKDKYKFIFIDEYQDTSPLVVELLLSHLQNSNKKNVIGFFGDAMQAIYPDGVGDLKTYLDDGSVTEVQKAQNRRNPMAVITLANRLRTDGLQQEPSSDEHAPNMAGGHIRPGIVKFYYSDRFNVDAIHRELNWDFKDATATKELYLTYNLIAPKAGFGELMAIYDKDPVVALKTDVYLKIKKAEKGGRPIEGITEEITFDQVVDIIQPKNRQKELKKDLLVASNPELYALLRDKPWSEVRKIYLDKDGLIDDKKQDALEESKKGSKRDHFVKHLFKIQDTIHFYDKGEYREFLRRSNYKIRTNKDKTKLKVAIEKLKTATDKTIAEVIEMADKEGICRKDDKLESFISTHEYLWERVKQVHYGQFQMLYKYLEGYTPFSTQHKIKGAEFDQVLVVLDNGNWSDYNFEYLFTNRTDKASVLERTKKIFYVCCTRAKEQLAIYYIAPTTDILKTAELWFGKENLKAID